MKLSERLEAKAEMTLVPHAAHLAGDVIHYVYDSNTRALLREAAAALRAVEGAATVYWVPNARVSSDGSYEDGPGSIVTAEDASPYEQSIGQRCAIVPVGQEGR